MVNTFLMDSSPAKISPDASCRTLNAKIAEHVKTVAWAIEHAHRNQIVHRDLKPANIIIDEYDQPRVTDFGLAKDTRRTQQLAQKEPQLEHRRICLGTDG